MRHARPLTGFTFVLSLLTLPAGAQELPSPREACKNVGLLSRGRCIRQYAREAEQVSTMRVRQEAEQIRQEQIRQEQEARARRR